MKLFELHTHPRGKIENGIAMAQAAHRRGCHGIVFTDHHYLWPEVDLAVVRTDVPEMIVFTGQEVSTVEGAHILVIGAEKRYRRNTSLQTLTQFPKKHVLIWAHPLRGKRPASPGDILQYVSGCEVRQKGHTPADEFEVVQWCIDRGMAMVAGTDSHRCTSPGMRATIFPGWVTSLGMLREAIKWNKVMPMHESWRAK